MPVSILLEPDIQPFKWCQWIFHKSPISSRGWGGGLAFAYWNHYWLIENKKRKRRGKKDQKKNEVQSHLHVAHFVGTNDVALSEVKSEKPLSQNGGSGSGGKGGEAAEGEESRPAADEDRPRSEKSVLQGKLTKLAIQIGYGGEKAFL